MKTIGIIYNSYKKKASDDLRKISSFLKKKNCKVINYPSNSRVIKPFDIAVSLGGDGTMLKAAKLCAPLDIPVLGVNLGSLGFIAETTPEEIFDMLGSILDNGFSTDERMMLNVNFTSGKKSKREIVLNEATVLSGEVGRVVTVNLMVNGSYAASYLGDGLIISTPTGSTAYSLAADGPIVHPSLSVFVVTPVCPHTLTQRAMIISAERAVSLEAISKDGLQKPLLALDGQKNYRISKKDKIEISLYEKPLRLIVNPKRKYFEVLREKLKWGERG